MTGDRMTGDGVTGDGVTGDGVTGDGVTGDGVGGDEVGGDGVMEVINDASMRRWYTMHKYAKDIMGGGIQWDDCGAGNDS